MSLVRDIPWPPITGKKTRLISFEKQKPGSYESYRERNLKDYPHLYSNVSEEEMRKKYDQFREYMNKFNGCCNLNQQISIIPTDQPNVIIFSTNWKGDISDHSDLELWFRSNRKYFWSLKKSFSCEIYSFGTLTVYPGSMEARMGERVGKSKISHCQGIYQVNFDNIEHPNKIELIKLSKWENEIAIFEIIN